MTEEEFYKELEARGIRRANEPVEYDPLAEYYIYGHGLYIGGPRAEIIKPEHRMFVIDDFCSRIMNLLKGPH